MGTVVCDQAVCGILDSMRKVLLTAACATLLVPVFASATPARLTILSRSTFTVRGLGFAPTERVRVRATAPGLSVTKWTTSGPLGGFTVALPTFTVGGCTGFVIRAVGATGDLATLHRLPPECPQPPTP